MKFEMKVGEKSELFEFYSMCYLILLIFIYSSSMEIPFLYFICFVAIPLFIIFQLSKFRIRIL